MTSTPSTAQDEPRGSLGRGFYAALVVSLLVIAALTAVVIQTRGPSATPLVRLTGIPSNISTETANLMALSPIPHRPAPSFTLTDQNAHTFSLSSFRGKTVVLVFMDPHCVDICPLVSQEFVDAYHDLGPAAKNAVFMAVNVNQYFASPASMMSFSRDHGLLGIPSWHFFTGSTDALRRVWAAYGITVEASNPRADIVHTSALYVIDPQGRERFLAMPVVEHHGAKSYLPANVLSTWGHGIAQLVRDVSAPAP